MYIDWGFSNPLGVTGLLRVNKFIAAEARSTFYSQNIFSFWGLDGKQVETFLHDIGSLNASHIQHILLWWPFTNLAHAEYAPSKIIAPADASMLAAIGEHSKNVKTLAIKPRTADGSLNGMDKRIAKRRVRRLLKKADKHFRVIPYLGRILLEVDEEALSAFIVRNMRKLGWTVNGEEGPDVDRYVEEDLGTDSEDDI
jgi:hypothetical protein